MKGDGKGTRTADDEKGRERPGAAVGLGSGRLGPVYPLGGHSGGWGKVKFCDKLRRYTRGWR